MAAPSCCSSGSPPRPGLGVGRLTAFLPPLSASLSASLSLTSATPSWLAASSTEVEAMNSRRETWFFGGIKDSVSTAQLQARIGFQHGFQRRPAHGVHLAERVQIDRDYLGRILADRK